MKHLDPTIAARLPIQIEVIAERYGFDRHEARLAVRLMRGTPLREAASEMGMTLGQARVQLSNLFRKTGTEHRNQLLYLLLRENHRLESTRAVGEPSTESEERPSQDKAGRC